MVRPDCNPAGRLSQRLHYRLVRVMPPAGADGRLVAPKWFVAEQPGPDPVRRAVQGANLVRGEFVSVALETVFAVLFLL